MTVQVDNAEKPLTFSIDKFDGIRLGMAVTTHRSQSMTIDKDVYILAGGSMQSLEMSVVQFSRAGTTAGSSSTRPPRAQSSRTSSSR